MIEKTSTTKKAVLFVRGDENSRKTQLESFKSYCDTHNLDIIKTFECDEKNLKHCNAFDEMVKYVKGKKSKMAIVAYSLSQLQTEFKHAHCLIDLRNKKDTEIHYVREALMLHKDSPKMDIAKHNWSIFANKIYVTLLKDNIRKSFLSKKR